MRRNALTNCPVEWLGPRGRPDSSNAHHGFQPPFISGSHQIEARAERLLGREILEPLHDGSSDSASLERRSNHDVDREAIHRAVADEASHADEVSSVDGADGGQASFDRPAAVIDGRPADGGAQGRIFVRRRQAVYELHEADHGGSVARPGRAASRCG